MNERGSPDWIELFLDYTKAIPSPDVFRLWSAIACVAGALERRVWITVSGKQLFPNLYTLLVANPGIGKTQSIEHVNELWHAVPGLHLAPHDVTKAALVDELSKATRKLIMGEATLVEYNSLLVAADEFGVLVPSHDLDFLSTLNRIFDNPPQHRQNRRGLQTQIDITCPQLNIIGGTQPAYLANLLPEEAWGMGFMSRVIMIHAGAGRRVKLFGGAELSKPLFAQLIGRLKDFTKLYGVMPWEFPAAEEAQRWNDSGLEPVPIHSKMEHYNARRLLHVLKLSIIAAVSSGHTTISLLDFTRARDWLLDVEKNMPDIFRAMVQKSDQQVIDELHFFCWQRFVQTKKPLHESTLIHFLHNRVMSEKIPRILEICVRANIFDREVDSNTFIPRIKNTHGLE